MGLILLLLLFASGVSAWTGKIHGIVVSNICMDSSLELEYHEGFLLSLSF